jgi:hypothetical protein
MTRLKSDPSERDGMKKLDKLRDDIAKSGKRKSDSLIGDNLEESGVLDRAVLNQKIEAILQEASNDPLTGRDIEHRLVELVISTRHRNIPEAAAHVTALLSLNLDDLQRAAMLSLMVRLVGKKRFDPVATYLLEKNAT